MAKRNPKNKKPPKLDANGNPIPKVKKPVLPPIKLKGFKGVQNVYRTEKGKYINFGCSKNCDAKFLITHKPLKLSDCLRMEEALVTKLLNCNKLIGRGRKCELKAKTPSQKMVVTPSVSAASSVAGGPSSGVPAVQ